MNIAATLVSALTGAPVEVITAYFQKKQELKQELNLAKIKAKTAVEVAKETRAKAADENDQMWEQLSLKNSGWKDEFELIVISIPMILCFFPQTVDYVHKGFDALAKTPIWYQGILITIYLANYGIRYKRWGWQRDAIRGNSNDSK